MVRYVLLNFKDEIPGGKCLSRNKCLFSDNLGPSSSEESSLRRDLYLRSNDEIRDSGNQQLSVTFTKLSSGQAAERKGELDLNPH